MIKTLAPSLRALLEGFIDYAGLFPPAKLPLVEVVEKYGQYKKSEHSWMLHRLVITAADLQAVPEAFDGSLAVLTDSDETRATSIETNKVMVAQRPVYCEVSPRSLSELDTVKSSACFAKIRTGGLKAEAIPAPADVAAFIAACAERRLAFKATAGLHHPIRSEQPLTYEADSPRATMHGFLNVLMASAFAWHGELKNIELVVAELDPSAFSFNEKAHWREHSLTVEQIRNARQQFIHSVGSCSFEEPVQDLEKLGLL